MKPLYLLLFLSFSAGYALGQNNTGFSEKYYYFISHAEYSHLDKAFRASALSYDSAFQSAGGKGRPGDRYQAACCWALAGDPDKAFFICLRHPAKTNGRRWSRP